MWKKLNIIMLACAIALGFGVNTYAEEYYDDDFVEDIEYDDYDSDYDYDYDTSFVQTPVQDDAALADQISSEALQDYDATGSLFEKITMLEQEKVVVQLEKERAQLDLELDRLNAERIKLQMELDTLSGRAEQQQHELEAAKTQLEIQTEQLRQQRNSMEDIIKPDPVIMKPTVKYSDGSISKRYRLINVVGVANQLQATVEELSTGQNKRISVGKDLDGYIVKSISLNDGIVFEKDGEEESLNIGK